MGCRLQLRNPRIASVAQYELRDDPRVAVFNTGLAFAGGRVKPAMAAYALGIYVERIGSHGRVFGLVRGGAHGATVRIQHASGTRFRTVAVVRTNAWGYLLTRVSGFRGRWRLVADGRVSRIARAGS